MLEVAIEAFQTMLNQEQNRGGVRGDNHPNLS
jgi:hypothetical protein